ncbi:MAG TPA: aminomethyl-transferring glycine dehydrogenase [Acidobacteriota bacterium]|nr:aminomethyl-transferring glycine dehydrogenase [Acidobacteriota bacterium]
MILRVSHRIAADSFLGRHLGPSDEEIAQMLEALGFSSLEELVDRAVPEAIRVQRPLDLKPPISEAEALDELRELASSNETFRSYIGTGYSDCITPPVIQRNILENPGWYTQYTPYQAEISQGRLQALLNFQTMVADLTSMEVSNASLLDEATAAAEAMGLAFAAKGSPERNRFLVAETCHPQTIDVIRTRAEPLGIEVETGDPLQFAPSEGVFAALVQFPDTNGQIEDWRDLADRVHQVGGLFIAAADLLALTLLSPPGEWGADVTVGSTQRFGVALGYGGPHAGYFATREEFKRLIPGRLVGVSRDRQRRPALRLALQTREQHIRRDKATSNICTAQVLPAVLASMYAVYHGPQGLKRIAARIHLLTKLLAGGLRQEGTRLFTSRFFDTIRLQVPDPRAVLDRARKFRVNLRQYDDGDLGISLDETTGLRDVERLIEVVTGGSPDSLLKETVDLQVEYGEPFSRESKYLEHPVFHNYHSETEMLRYIHRLQKGDLSLTTSMIPLGSCTMKLNAAVEMLPITWQGFGSIHPFAPLSQTEGYQRLIRELEEMLAEITGLGAVSLQPNAGAQGEYAGLLAIRGFHRSLGQGGRDVCLIPTSAHGTNPASAVMAGLKVVKVDCDDDGNVDLNHLRSQAERFRGRLAALMITYPSTHGVFEEGIVEICEVVHSAGGQVYMDGANMNAQVGICRPCDFGVDVCHLNLHKTFCIPHGGGGPGVGPIAVASHLAPFLPGHFFTDVGGQQSIGAISAAPWGSAGILPISWAYIRLMGTEGLVKASQVAILNANYVAHRLDDSFPVLFRGKNGTVAHECILDCRRFRKKTGISVIDIAKRLIDYGFHAPTVSWPVVETLMVEPTESESKAELDRFCEAMISIRKEIEEIEMGIADPGNNVLRNAPHTAEMLAEEPWKHPYSREKAVFPTASSRRNKFWPLVGRVDEAYGDRNLVCACPPVESFAQEGEEVAQEGTVW